MSCSKWPLAFFWPNKVIKQLKSNQTDGMTGNSEESKALTQSLLAENVCRTVSWKFSW